MWEELPGNITESATQAKQVLKLPDPTDYHTLNKV